MNAKAPLILFLLLTAVTIGSADEPLDRQTDRNFFLLDLAQKTHVIESHFEELP